MNDVDREDGERMKVGKAELFWCGRHKRWESKREYKKERGKR